MTGFDQLDDDMQRGMRGENLALSTGKKKYDNLIGGVGGATYTLVGANLGVGKTALVDDAYVLTPYIMSLNSEIKIRTFYYSFEISKRMKLAKWVCYLAFIDKGIIMDVMEVHSRKSKLTADKYELIQKYRPFVDRMEDWVIIKDRSLNPTGLYMDMRKYALANGKEEVIKKTLENGFEIEETVYKPNNPKIVIQYIEDHIGLARGEKDLHTKKEIIDKGSQYAVELRNSYRISKVAIQQFNREIGDIDRRRFSELTPQLEDFKDSGNASEDADVVVALFNPMRYNLQTYSGVNVQNFEGRYRNAVVLKHRYGKDMVKLHLNMLGEVGHFRELPDPFMTEHYEKARLYKPW